MMKQLVVIFCMLLLAGCMTSKSFAPNLVKPVAKKGKFIDSFQPGNSESEDLSKKIVKKPKTRPALDYDLIESQVISAYLNGIKNDLLEHWPGESREDITIYVTTNRAFSAYSTPWDIVLSMGILTDVQSEDELAFIIGHELSHILLGHHEIPEYFKNQEKLVNFTSNVSMVATVVENMEVLRKGGSLTVQQQNKSSTQRKIRDAYKTALAVNSLSNDVINSFLNRRNEEEADFLGTDLLVKAGYSAYGYGKALERVESSLVFTQEQLKEEKAKYQGIVTILSSDTIPKEDNGLGLLVYLAGNEFCTEVLHNLAELYYGPDKRKTSLAVYLQREYPKERRRRLKTAELKHSLKSGVCWQTLANYWNASEALRALEHGDVKTAEKLAKKSVGQPTNRLIYPRLALSSVRLKQGNLKKAAANVNMIENWQNASFDTVLKASRLNRKVGQHDIALELLKNGGKALGVECAIYPEMITVYKETGDDLKAASILERCNTQADAATREKCMAVSGGLVPSSQNEPTGFNLFNKLKKSFLTN